MLFLIDYENVGKAGMKGCDYLNAQDHMIIFYSEARRHMEQRILEQYDSFGKIAPLVNTTLPMQKESEQERSYVSCLKTQSMRI